nr:hypothetical protein [Tanacetum cinerariifolium]
MAARPFKNMQTVYRWKCVETKRKAEEASQAVLLFDKIGIGICIGIGIGIGISIGIGIEWFQFPGYVGYICSELSAVVCLNLDLLSEYGFMSVVCCLSVV